MPVQRVSKSFKDIGSTFQVNPLSNDMLAIKNEMAIARSVRNLVFTLQGEKFFNPDLGSRVSRALFDNIDPISASIIKEEIENTINRYEPRVELINVVVAPNYDNNEFNVTLNYTIVGIDALPQQLSFALLQTR